MEVVAVFGVGGDHGLLPLVAPEQVARRHVGEQLGEGVDHVVVGALGEGDQFVEEVAPPIRLFRDEHPPALDEGRDGVGAGELVAVGLDGDQAQAGFAL